MRLLGRNTIDKAMTVLSKLFHLYTCISLGLETIKQHISHVHRNPMEFRDSRTIPTRFKRVA